MKTLNIIIILATVLAAQFLNAQDSVKDFIISKTYAGFLYAGTYENNEKQGYWNHSGSTRIGLKAQYNLGFGTLNSEVRNDNFDLKTTRSNVWYENNFSWITVKLGPSLPRIISQNHRPNPISMPAHFLPNAKAIIPGASAGANFTLHDILQGNTLQAGISEGRWNEKSILEYGINICQKWENGSVNLGGFYNQSTAGFALSIDFKNCSGTYFRNTDSLQSLFLSINTKMIGLDAGNIFLNTVHNFQKNTFQPLQIGITRNILTTLNQTTINLLVGLGYQIKPIQKMNIYLLFYL